MFKSKLVNVDEYRYHLIKQENTDKELLLMSNDLQLLFDEYLDRFKCFRPVTPTKIYIKDQDSYTDMVLVETV